MQTEAAADEKEPNCITGFLRNHVPTQEDKISVKVGSSRIILHGQAIIGF